MDGRLCRWLPLSCCDGGGLMTEPRCCKVFPLGTFPAYKYVVILSRMDSRWLLSRHKQRTTWETQGGHIEAGETPAQAAERELREESGAVDYSIRPLFDYWAGSRTGSDVGVVFLAEIRALGPMPGYEMAETRLFEQLPEALTYPWITNVIAVECLRQIQA